jgi:hypothetical protein
MSSFLLPHFTPCLSFLIFRSVLCCQCPSMFVSSVNKRQLRAGQILRKRSALSLLRNLKVHYYFHKRHYSFLSCVKWIHFTLSHCIRARDAIQLKRISLAALQNATAASWCLNFCVVNAKPTKPLNTFTLQRDKWIIYKHYLKEMVQYRERKCDRFPVLVMSLFKKLWIIILIGWWFTNYTIFDAFIAQRLQKCYVYYCPRKSKSYIKCYKTVFQY